MKLSAIVLILDIHIPTYIAITTPQLPHPKQTLASHHNMERTPSPPRRIHTPPAPLHGDTYEPFSPRRSSRVAAQRDIHSHQQERSTPRTRRDITPTASSSKRSAARANASFALSPPSSPVTSQQPRSPRSIRRAPLDLNPLDSDSDNAAPTSSRRTLFANMAPVRCMRRLTLGPLRLSNDSVEYQSASNYDTYGQTY